RLTVYGALFTTLANFSNAYPAQFPANLWQTPHRVIADTSQIEPIRRECRRRPPAILQLQQLPHEFGRMAALADIDQRADHVAYLMMQKSISAEIEQQPAIRTADLCCVHDFHRRLGLTFGGAKSAEIMLSQQEFCRLLHGSEIKRLVKPA